MKKLCQEFVVHLFSLLVSDQSCWADYFIPTHEITWPTLFNISKFLNLCHYSNYSHASDRKFGTVNFKRNWVFDSRFLLPTVTTVVECQFVPLRIMQFVDFS